MNVKIWAYLGIIVVVLGFIRWAYVAVYDAGYNAAIVEMEHLVSEAERVAREDEAEIWRALVDAAEAEIIIEERIVEVVTEVPVTEYVERIVEIHPECSDLPELGELFNAQIRAGNNQGADSPGPASSPD